MCFALFVALAGLCACSEVKEAGEYDNWQARNEVFADSLKALSRQVVTTAAQADAVETGSLFAIETMASTTKTRQYVYCKKLAANTEGARPLYTRRVEVYYYGTLINGKRFDGNFTGYSATDRGTLSAEANLPTEFDSPSTFTVSSLVSGMTAALQYMRVGERWMIYIPYPSGYGSQSSGSVQAYSALTFDVILRSID